MLTNECSYQNGRLNLYNLSVTSTKLHFRVETQGGKLGTYPSDESLDSVSQGEWFWECLTRLCCQNSVVD